LTVVGLLPAAVRALLAYVRLLSAVVRELLAYVREVSGSAGDSAWGDGLCQAESWMVVPHIGHASGPCMTA